MFSLTWFVVPNGYRWSVEADGNRRFSHEQGKRVKTFSVAVL